MHGDGRKALGGGRMNQTGGNATVELPSPKQVRASRLALRLAIALSCLAYVVAMSAPPASASGGRLAGLWTSVDIDGSNQTLTIKGAGNPAYSMVLRDDFTSGACDGPPAKVVGHGRAAGNDLFIFGTMVCLHGGNPIPGERISFGLEYDVATDTLTDSAGVVWERTN